MTAANDTHTTKKTREAHFAYMENRSEAGRVIDIETCEYTWFFADAIDPYCTFPQDDDVFQQYGGCIGRCWFVRSDESDGWIRVGDLSDEKWQALQLRMEREPKLWKAACAVHPMYEVDTHKLAKVGWFVWKGDGEEPSRGALIEWFKVNHPTLASEKEREIRARIKAKREQDGDFELPF